MNAQSCLWAGTEESWWAYVQAAEQTQAALNARGASAADPMKLPPLLQVQESVGVIQISGPLIPGSAGFMRYFGITGYADIQAAMTEALASKDTKSILAVYATGGGAVEGVDETSQLISQVSNYKPVVSFSAGNMLSAGFWLGSSGTRRLASRTSMVGSIGVVMTHMDHSEQLKKEGVNATVIRSGKWKALGNPVEPLSDEAKKELQAIVDDMNQIFEARVADNLGVSAKTVHSQMGQGRQFLGVRAVEAGLINGVSSFQQAFDAAKLLGRG